MTNTLCGNILFAIPLAGTELGLMVETPAGMTFDTLAMTTTVLHVTTFSTEIAVLVAVKGGVLVRCERCMFCQPSSSTSCVSGRRHAASSIRHDSN